MKELRVPGTSTRVLRRVALAREAALTAAGVRARIVGSLAYGDVRSDSDLDLLVLAHRGRSWAQVQSLAEDAARPYGVPVDVIFADTLPAAVRRAMLKDAVGAGDLSASGPRRSKVARRPRTPSPRARAAGTRRTRS